MATPVLYAALTDLKDRLGIADNDRDFALERCLDGASRWIERETARRFYVTTQTRYYTAESKNWIPPSDISERPGGGAQTIGIDDIVVPLDDNDLPVYPTIATDWDGDGVYEQTWTVATDYWLGPRNAAADGKPYRFLNRNEITGRYFFPRYENAVSITGSFGFCEVVPTDIGELCLDVAELLARSVLDMVLPGVESYRIGDMQASLKSDSLPTLARQTLQNYKHGAL